jgi:hypothetical protein
MDGNDRGKVSQPHDHAWRRVDPSEDPRLVMGEYRCMLCYQTWRLGLE